MSARIHPTAIIEQHVEIGEETSIWDNVHIRGPTRIGRRCIIGEKTYIAYGVEIGDLVKVNAFVYICTAVTIRRGVMISAGTIFTNDRYPRATDPSLSGLRVSDPDDETLPTLVSEGATIGARAVIGCGLEIGSFAMIGMGSVVTRSVPQFHLVLGHPARTVAYICRCGKPFRRLGPGGPASAVAGDITANCSRCGRCYCVVNGEVIELGSSASVCPDAAGMAAP